jgi:hypothetical protein
MIKVDLIKVEIVDNDDLFLFIANLLKRIEKKRPDHLKVIRIDNNLQTILFISSTYVGANLLRILMEQEQQFSWHEQKEGAVKVERVPLQY